jgi:hypothetical protein
LRDTENDIDKIFNEVSISTEPDERLNVEF